MSQTGLQPKVTKLQSLPPTSAAPMAKMLVQHHKSQTRQYLHLSSSPQFKQQAAQLF